MISKHSAHLTPLPFGIRTWLWRYIYLLLLISMLWHRQAIFESKWDKLSSSAGGRIRTQRVSDTYSPADWMPADKPTELSKIKLKNLNSTARPYDQQAFSPPDPAAIWHSHLALAIYIFDVVNFDALAQASDFRIERRQVVFLCWRQDSNPEVLRHLFASRLNACWKLTELSRIKLKNLNSTARPYDQQAFSPPDPTAIWISNQMHIKVWDEITYPFPNFNRWTAEVWEWISNFIPHFIMDIILLIHAGIRVKPC